MHIKSAYAPCSNTMTGSCQNLLQCFKAVLRLFTRVLQQNKKNTKIFPTKIFMKIKLSQNLLFHIRRGVNKPCNEEFLFQIMLLFRKVEKTFWKYYVNLSKRVRTDRVFLGLVGLLFRISLKHCPRKVPRSSPVGFVKPRPSLLFCLD